MAGVINFFKQLIKQLWQVALYVLFIVPPAIAGGIACSALLLALQLVTRLRDGTCDERTWEAFITTEKPLAKCTHVVGAHRWLFFFLSFSGVFVAFLYTFLGNDNATGGSNTVLRW